LTLSPGWMYIASVGKRRDEWPGVAIYGAAKKAISYKSGNNTNAQCPLEKCHPT